MKTIIIDGIEYNLTPKVLFKKGDFVVIQETTYLISKIEGLNVTLSCNGRECLFDIDVLKNAHLWTIQDAKDGDILVDDLGNICIYQEPSTKLMYHSFCYGNHKYFIDGGGSHKIVGTCPSTKEQRDLLFQKMKEAGYEWDAEKKELKKIEQNSAWSEEDKNMIRFIGNAITATDSAEYLKSKHIGIIDAHTWLENLRNRVQPQPKQEWSEDDKSMLYGVIETEQYLLDIINGKKNPDIGNEQIISDCREELEWLKSLTPRSQWKPSDEQMIAIDTAINVLGKGTLNGKQLIDLQEQLKRLKGE